MPSATGKRRGACGEKVAHIRYASSFFVKRGRHETCIITISYIVNNKRKESQVWARQKSVRCIDVHKKPLAVSIPTIRFWSIWGIKLSLQFGQVESTRFHCNWKSVTDQFLLLTFLLLILKRYQTWRENTARWWGGKGRRVPNMKETGILIYIVSRKARSADSVDPSASLSDLTLIPDLSFEDRTRLQKLRLFCSLQLVGGCPPPPPPHKVFSNFWKNDLLYNAETFGSCSFILCGNFDMSTMRLWYLTLPWQRHKYKQVLPKIVIFTIFLNCFQFFKTQVQDVFIFTFGKHSGLISYQFPLFSDFLRKCWNPRWRIQDGGSNDVTPIKIMSSCKVS